MLDIKQPGLCVLTVCVLLFMSNVYAGGEGHVTEMSLVLQSNDINLKYPGSVDSIKISAVEVNLWQSFTESVDARLSIASIELSQKNNATVSAYDATGYMLGIGFRGNIIESEFVTAGLSFGFDYLAITGETNTNQAVDVSWYESSVSADFEFFPSNPVSFLTGASYTRIDGEHDVTGTGTLVSFSEDEPGGYYIGLAFKAARGGEVVVTWQGGYRQGVFLSFSNRF